MDGSKKRTPEKTLRRHISNEVRGKIASLPSKYELGEDGFIYELYPHIENGQVIYTRRRACESKLTTRNSFEEWQKGLEIQLNLFFKGLIAKKVDKTELERYARRIKHPQDTLENHFSDDKEFIYFLKDEAYKSVLELTCGNKEQANQLLLDALELDEFSKVNIKLGNALRILVLSNENNQTEQVVADIENS